MSRSIKHITMQYVWNLVSWFRCSTSVPPVNPGDAPTEPPKESKTEKGWKMWAAGTKRKEEKVAEEVKEAAQEIPKEAEAVIEACKEAVEAAKSGDVEEAVKEAVKEATEAVVTAAVATVVEEAKSDVKSPLPPVPEESQELVPDNKKKVQEKGEDGAKDLGDDFVPHN